MKARKLKTVKADISKWEIRLSNLEQNMKTAQHREVEMRKRKEKVALKLEPSEIEGNEKLSSMRGELLKQSLVIEDFESNIRKAQEKLESLDTELKEAKGQEGRELIREFGKKLELEHGKAIDEAIGKLVEIVTTAQDEAREVNAQVQSQYNFGEQNLPYKLNQIVASFLGWRLYLIFPRQFQDFRPHRIYRKDTLSEVVKTAFARWSDDKPDPVGPKQDEVIKADFSNMRVIPQEEAVAQAAARMQMKQDAEKLRREVVTV